MLWPKKNSYNEFDNEKKFPYPPPHNFSNRPSLNYIKSNLAISNSVNSTSPLFRRKIEFPWIYPYIEMI